MVKAGAPRLLALVHRLPGLLFGMLLAACSNDSAQPAVDYTQDGPVAIGDMYVSAVSAKATNLVPWLAGESASSDITAHIYEALLTLDGNLNLTCDLCESYTISPDGTEISFQLKQNVLWSDGQPFTARDVSATFHAVRHPNTRTPYGGDYQLVQSFTTPDDYTVHVTYPEPFAPALASWAGLQILPAHILVLDADVNETRLKTQPVGTGPYTLESWGETETVLLANPTHHAGQPNITKLRSVILPDQDTQFLQLQAGGIDAMGLKPVQFTRLTDGPDFAQNFAKYHYLGFQYTYLGFNLHHPLFADATVRNALSYATPRQQLVDAVLLGQGEVISGPFKPGTWAYHTGLTPHPYDLEQARALFAQAGWVDSDQDGVLDKNGTPFTFTLVTNQGNDQRIKTAEILQNAYAQVGVRMEILVQEWRTFIENTIHPRNFAAFILGWSLTPEPDPYDIWHSSKTGPREFNMLGYNNPRVDELLHRARTTLNQTERKQYLDEFQAILHAEQPALLLYAPYALVAIHRRFKGITPAPAGLSYNQPEWYVPLSQQKYLLP